GLIWVFGITLIPLWLLAGLVAWARWREGLHTVAQLLVGILTAIVVTAAVYWILWGPLVSLL
ncbi:MAG: phosphatidic acid phosphatase, partial [Candidatus Hermodarchaeota archaeon]|nr:phosphatidic acid phosphatase [Candidatus Hermodarchaeota archaeon]